MIVLPKRRSIRLAGVDYQEHGEYFITLCVALRRPLFGCYQNQGIRLNTIGHMIDDQWRVLIARFPSLVLDAYVVMPDHFHAIVHKVAGDINVAPTIGVLVGMFKHHTYQAYLKGVPHDPWRIVSKKLWQRNYFEHIIRNDVDYQDCQAYILNNPYEGWRKQGNRAQEVLALRTLAR